MRRRGGRCVLSRRKKRGGEEALRATQRPYHETASDRVDQPRMRIFCSCASKRMQCIPVYAVHASYLHSL
jgi:hypothetical protein